MDKDIKWFSNSLPQSLSIFVLPLFIALIGKYQDEENIVNQWNCEEASDENYYFTNLKITLNKTYPEL